MSVVASFMLDFVIQAPRRPARGETVLGTRFDTFLGGKGFNQSVAARRAGAPVAVIGRLGDDDFGLRFRASLADEGIDDRHVVTDLDEGTGIASPLVEPGGENSIVIVPRANLAVSPADIEAAADTIATSGVLLLQLEVPPDAVAAAATCAHGAGVPVMLNPAPAADVLDLLAGSIDVLVPNEAEAAALAGGSVDDDPAALAGRSATAPARPSSSPSARPGPSSSTATASRPSPPTTCPSSTPSAPATPSAARSAPTSPPVVPSARPSSTPTPPVPSPSPGRAPNRRCRRPPPSPSSSRSPRTRSATTEPAPGTVRQRRTSGAGSAGDRYQRGSMPARNSTRAALVSSGFSCCTQWPAPSMSTVPRSSVSHPSCTAGGVIISTGS